MNSNNTYLNDFVSIDRTVINSIPCLKFRPKIQEELPTVIYYHGWGSNKENQIFKASIIASSGYQVIVPDAIYHGERNPIDHHDLEVMKNYFWNVVINTVEEAEQLIKSIIDNNVIVSNKIGVIGHSMGGFISSGVFSIMENIECMINLNGSCAWVQADKKFREMYNQRFATEEEILKLKKYDLLKKIKDMKLRPILMIHGESDSTVPIDSQQYFYNEIKYLYNEKPEEFKLIKYPRLDHYMTVGMLEEAILWFKKYL